MTGSRNAAIQPGRENGGRERDRQIDRQTDAQLDENFKKTTCIVSMFKFVHNLLIIQQTET